MGMYRCAACGSSHVVVDTKKEGFSVSKAVTGTVLFGAAGAVMGVNGKEQLYYHCADCGQTLSYPMTDVKKNLINTYLSDPEKYRNFLEREKIQYPNIEWEDCDSEILNISSQTKENIVKSQEEIYAESRQSAAKHESVGEIIIKLLSGEVKKTTEELYSESGLRESCGIQYLAHVLRNMVIAEEIEKEYKDRKTYYALPGVMARIAEKERLIALEEVKKHNDKINEQIAILQKERAEQETIVSQNALKFFGAGAQAKKDAQKKISDIDVKISDLRSSMKLEF